MTISLSTLITREHGGHEFEIELQCECNFTPDRPAPFCSNPDSAAFSDSGDPGELEVVKATIVSCTDITVTIDPEIWLELKPGDVLPKHIELTDVENQTLFEKAYESMEEDGPEYDPEE